ncbi:hypothetical protein [uncultured Meiothermus sp.]|jgi:hypothetical protein|uniref:hypothetical protein n=1 Tax=uncultured Meiothermus sp. TaxID=157471 RepID=UPI00262104F6|nr:hypothetical protein [uncultured Meiothermus sp.]
MKREVNTKQKTKWPEDFPVLEPTGLGKPVLPKPIKLKPGKKSSLEYVQEQRR